MEAEHGILGLDVEQAKAMIRKRGAATLRESVFEDQRPSLRVNFNPLYMPIVKKTR